MNEGVLTDRHGRTGGGTCSFLVISVRDKRKAKSVSPRLR